MLDENPSAPWPEVAFPVSENNVRSFRAPGLTIKVRVKSIPQLTLVAPSGAPEYWQLDLLNQTGQPSIKLGTVDELSAPTAKAIAKALIRNPAPTRDDGPKLKYFFRAY